MSHCSIHQKSDLLHPTAETPLHADTSTKPPTQTPHTSCRNHSFHCLQCNSKCSTISTMRRHVRSVHTIADRFKCKYCPYGTYYRRRLEKHEKSIHKGRNFRCLHCPFAARDDSALRAHMHVHINAHPRYHTLLSYSKETSRVIKLGQQTEVNRSAEATKTTRATNRGKQVSRNQQTDVTLQCSSAVWFPPLHGVNSTIPDPNQSTTQREHIHPSGDPAPALL